MKICPVCSTEYPDDVRFCPNDGQTLRASSPAHDLVGQVVADRYHVVRKLGEGGMGQVYLAEHVKMGRRSAIKVMNPAMVHDPDAVARFNREAANASRITHPNVCAIYDFGETPDGLIYLAMEFIEGEPLTDLLERERALPVRRAVSIFIQVADALQAAHDLGIVHRDLKPDNIMLTRGRDGVDIVKVVDFGIAKAVGGDDTQKVTRTGMVVGTPEFMSPEQLSGDKLDGRSDIYSLALVLFKTLTGKLPFEATTVQETMIKRLTDDPQRLAAARPDLRFPPGLQETLDAGLTRDPVDRYQSAAKFATDVAGIAGLERRGAAGPVAPLPPTRADAEQRTRLLEPAAPRPGTAARPAPAKRRSLVPIIAGTVLVLGGGGAAVAVFAGGGGKTGGAVRPDTAPQRAAGNAVDTARFPATPPANPQPQEGGGQVRRLAGVDPATAGALLDALIERPGTVILDSALLVYDMPGVQGKDRAFAACLRAQAFRSLSHNDSARVWARLGLQLDPGLKSCQQIVQNAGGP
ncbi:MAG TPA: serine/threonine-protein kinase [Gemmatimonadales bacterium]